MCFFSLQTKTTKHFIELVVWQGCIFWVSFYFFCFNNIPQFHIKITKNNNAGLDGCLEFMLYYVLLHNMWFFIIQLFPYPSDEKLQQNLELSIYWDQHKHRVIQDQLVSLRHTHIRHSAY